MDQITFTLGADEITGSHVLTQLHGLDSESESGRYCFGANWGVRKKRTGALACNANEVYVAGILLELDALFSESDFCRTCFRVNWGIRRKRSKPVPKPVKATQVSSSPIESRDFDLNKAFAAQARRRRFKICRAKTSITGYGSRYVVLI
jgi:hypothetical protein